MHIHRDGISYVKVKTSKLQNFVKNNQIGTHFLNFFLERINKNIVKNRVKFSSHIFFYEKIIKLKINNQRTISYDTASISFLEPKIWFFLMNKIQTLKV